MAEEKEKPAQGNGTNEFENDERFRYLPPPVVNLSGVKEKKKEGKTALILFVTAMTVAMFIVFSAIVMQFSFVKAVLEWEEGTPEPESEAVFTLIAFLAEVALIAALDVGFVMLGRKRIKRSVARETERAQKQALEQYPTQHRQEICSVCELCGTKLTKKSYRGEWHTSYEDHYYLDTSVNQVIKGHTTSNTTGSFEGAYHRYRCAKCGYEISNKPLVVYACEPHQTELTVQKSGPSAERVRNTFLYQVMEKECFY